MWKWTKMSTIHRSRLRSNVIIFDFDLTLVDTQPVEALRAARNWKSVMARAPELEVYDGVHELLVELDARGETLAIVTKSPDMVPRHFVERYRWPIGIVLGYHQVKRRKPDPEALLLAMRKASAGPDGTFHVGDRPEDTEASRAAGRGGDRGGMGTGRHRASRGIEARSSVHVRRGVARVLSGHPVVAPH